MKNRLFSVVASIFIFVLLLVGCNNGDDGTGDSSNNNPVSPVTQTGTLQGRVSIPLENTRLSSSLSSDSAVIASVSKNIENDSAIRAVQSFYGTKVWLEDLPDIFSYTDEQGNYTIANVPFGQHRVVANLKVGSNEYKWRSDKQNVLDTKIVVVPQIVMIPANTSISGFIYDSVTKQPVQGVIVEVWGQKSTSSFDGSYTVYNMPTGSWDVTYTKTGYNTMTTPISFVEGSSSSGNFYLVPSNGGSPTPASETLVITLNNLIPSYKAAGVSTQTSIVAAFNDSRVNIANAKIKFNSGNQENISGNFTFQNNSLIYTHGKAWSPNTLISGEIYDLKDIYGKAIATISFEFTTAEEIKTYSNLKFDLYDSKTKNRISDDVIFSMNINGNLYTNNVKTWRETGIDTFRFGEITVSIKDESNPLLYNPASFTVSTMNDLVRSLYLEPVPLPMAINIKFDFIDARTGNRVDDNETFAVNFDGIVYTKRAMAWRELGVDILSRGSEIAVSVINDTEPALYNPASFTFSSTNNQLITQELTPVTYSLNFQFLNLPQYLTDSETNKPTLMLFVEDNSTNPPQYLDSVTVTDFDKIAVIPAMRNPERVRIRMKGYQDEVIDLKNEMQAGARGSYKLEVDFALEDGHRDDDPVSGSEFNGKVGMLDNVIKSNIVVNMIGLAENDKASIVPNFKPDVPIRWPYGSLNDMGLANSLGQVQAVMEGCPTYFDMTYTIIVYPDNPASGSYTINCDKAVPIPVPSTASDTTTITVDCSK